MLQDLRQMGLCRTQDRQTGEQHDSRWPATEVDRSPRVESGVDMLNQSDLAGGAEIRAVPEVQGGTAKFTRAPLGQSLDR
eukprot:6186628-Pleurochrysis_carterae.AAC.2